MEIDKNEYFKQALSCIDPASCSYQEWVNVGMALQTEDMDVSMYEEWSQRDTARYHRGECEKKWKGFSELNATKPVTGATITQMAKKNGFAFHKQGRELDWNDPINIEGVGSDKIDMAWSEPKDIKIPDPKTWDGVQDAIKYLKAVFDEDDKVGYVVQSYTNDDGKCVPSSKGAYDRTAGRLIAELKKYRNMEDVFGTSDPDAGAWIRFNPMDGNGAKNENVAKFKYALVEGDNMPLGKQLSILENEELALPIAAITYSGNKSIHAIIHVDAKDMEEYRGRVEHLYKVLKQNGFSVDTQNKNPSRLSRLPGVTRAGVPQFLISTHKGRDGYEDWLDWLDDRDGLPKPESLDKFWGNLPPLAPPLIDGVLRQGHKMLLAGPSKAGKSFLLIELVISIAEGKPWLGFDCAGGRVMYINLELDEASCLHRFADVYKKMGLSPDHISNIDLWNLRGKSVPMNKLAPKLIKRAGKMGYIAVIIDPIYKVITGDENSAADMAQFCNLFDTICTELKCAVIYCHHHSKGYQGGKRSMDRASGSGVFARDPDALLDLIELDVKDEDKSLNSDTAWRIEGTLREFPRFEPVNCWFRYPVHVLDDTGMLSMAGDAGAEPSWKEKKRSFRERQAENKKSGIEKLDTAVSACSLGESGPTLKDVSEYLGVSDRTLRRYVKESGKYQIDNLIIKPKEVN